VGSVSVVSLAEARDRAHEARKLLQAGENPIAAKRRAALASAGIPTFGAVADELLAAKRSEWRNEKHQAQWRSSLMEMARPSEASEWTR
jgi:hypothetical protein